MIRQLITIGADFMNHAERGKLDYFEQDLQSLNEELNSDELLVKAKLASDLLHMHMNRIFSAEQRKKELVIYYLCLRHYLSEQARNGIKADGMSAQVMH